MEFLKTATALRTVNNHKVKLSFLDFDEYNITLPMLYDGGVKTRTQNDTLDYISFKKYMISFDLRTNFLFW